VTNQAGHRRLHAVDFPFVGIPTFLRSPLVLDPDKLDADIAILGAPFDEGSPYMPGSRFGPRGIREHSLRFTSASPGYFNPQTRRTYLEREMREARIADVGDAQVLPTNVVGTFDDITNRVSSVLGRGAIPVVLGGDHAVTYPVVRAFDVPLHVVHFDAHLDYMPFVHGLSMTNQHAFRHIAHMDHVLSITQVGIRSIRNSAIMLSDTEADGNHVVTLEVFRSAQGATLFSHIPRNAPCYVSIDIDVLDMPLVPGCVSAEPDGLSYAELRTTLAALAESFEIVGFDLVEVNPQLDIGTGITSYIAAHTIVEFLGAICDQHWWRSRRSS
jgi:agmatinase